MRKRKLLAALAVGLAVLVAAALWPRTPRGERISRDNFGRLRIGMGRAEVEAILGPPGDYRTGPVRQTKLMICLHNDAPASNGPEPPDPVCWATDTERIEVTFDPHDTVVAADFAPTIPEPLAPLDNLQWHAKRQWRKWFPEK
jgi:hypothetical protein